MAVKRLAVIAVLFLIPALARADSVWTYQGNVSPSASPYDGYDGNALTGTVLLNNNDQAIAWKFVAGPDVFTNFNSTGSINPFACVNCTQPFAFWDIALDIPTEGTFGTHLISFSDGPGFVSPYYIGFGAFDIAWKFDGTLGQVVSPGNPGVWTEIIATPEPGAGLLLLSGLLGLGVLCRKVLA